MLRRFLTQRKYPRFFTLERTSIEISPYNPKGQKVRKFQILDISERGCAFIYNGMKKDLKESGVLSLLSGETPYLEKVDFITASDIPYTKTGNDSGRLRRRSIEFKWFGTFQQTKVREFIVQNAIARAS